MELLFIILDILKSGLPYALLALGIFLTYRMLDFADLSAEGSFNLGGAVALTLTAIGVNAYLSILIGVVAGFLAGVVTGLLHTKLKIASLLSGIITMTGLIAINLVIMGLANPSSPSSNAVNIGSFANGVGTKSIFDYVHIFNMPIVNQILVMLVFVGVALGFVYWFFGTEIGMSVRATGMNPKMARAQGINTTRMIILGLGISNALIACGGALWAHSARSYEIGNGTGALVIGLASIIIGETVFGKKTFKNWIFSVVLGTILYFAVIQIALVLNFPHYLMKLLYAVLITVALSIPLIQSKMGKKGAK